MFLRLGELMVKVQHLAQKEHRHHMVMAREPRGLCWGGWPYSPVSSLPSWHSDSGGRLRAHSVRFRQCWEGCGGNGRAIRGALRGCCPLTQSPGSSANHWGGLYGAIPAEGAGQSFIFVLAISSVILQWLVRFSPPVIQDLKASRSLR
jgi:hypothetical protein